MIFLSRFGEWYTYLEVLRIYKRNVAYHFKQIITILMYVASNREKKLCEATLKQNIEVKFSE